MAIKWPGIDIKKFYTNLILRYRPQVPWLSPLGPKFWCHFFSQTMQEICCFITFFGLLLKIVEFHVSIIGTAVCMSYISQKAHGFNGRIAYCNLCLSVKSVFNKFCEYLFYFYDFFDFADALYMFIFMVKGYRFCSIIWKKFKDL